MADKTQYVSSHSSGVEVQVTYPRELEVEEKEALKLVVDAFNFFLGELETADSADRKGIMQGFGSLLRQVGVMKGMLKQLGRFECTLSIIRNKRKGKSKFEHHFSEN